MFKLGQMLRSIVYFLKRKGVGLYMLITRGTYCELTYANEHIKYNIGVGKVVALEEDGLYGLCVGYLDNGLDYYYIILDTKGKTHYISMCGSMGVVVRDPQQIDYVRADVYAVHLHDFNFSAPVLSYVFHSHVKPEYWDAILRHHVLVKKNKLKHIGLVDEDESNLFIYADNPKNRRAFATSVPKNFTKQQKKVAADMYFQQK
jgi:hypothetical protein